jgi:hypothetical protein
MAIAGVGTSVRVGGSMIAPESVGEQVRISAGVARSRTLFVMFGNKRDA